MRYKLTIEYDGTNLLGWQKQDEGHSVQGLLEEAIFGFCQERIALTCAGRTDAGVHARGQVAHADLETSRSPYHIMQGINHHLLIMKAPVVVLMVEPVSDDFHARFSARNRRYEYHILLRTTPLVLEANRAWKWYKKCDVEAMRTAASYLIGTHDFTSFRAVGCQAKHALRTLGSIEITQVGNRIIISVEALSFLHHMVRNIVGTLMLVAEGSWQPIDVQKALEAKDRKLSGPTAPACGLYFMEVSY